MRLFIAIPFDPPVLDALTAAQTSLKSCGVRGGYTVRRNLHMTVAFLGEVQDPRPVIEVLSRVTVPQTSMTFAQTEMFRDTLVCSFRVDPLLRQYVQKLREELDKSGIGFDRKPFRPHVTLVRRTSLPPDRQDLPRPESSLCAINIPASRICLMRTDFVDGKPKYTCMGTFTGS